MASELEKCVNVLQAVFDEGIVFQSDLGVDFHAPVYTCEQAQDLCPRPPGVAHMKNLFLKNKKKKFFLVSALVDSNLDLNRLPFGKSLRLASSDDLRKKLHLLPGSVTPFGLLADAEHG